MLTKIMTLVTDEYKFKKVISNRTPSEVYVFDEFGSIVDSFDSYARTFEELQEDVEFYLKSNAESDSEVFKKILMENWFKVDKEDGDT